MNAADCTKTLLNGLGKATLRGVRRCPKCGTFNGTRGVSCKNKQCDVVFKESEQRVKKNVSADAVKIVTGASAHVYSVRVRDRGPDYRGFVQLPVIQELESSGGTDGHDESSLDTATAELITQTSAKCFICKKSDSDVTIEACWHIKAAINSYLEAVPLILKNSVLNSLSLSNDTKQAIWCLATETAAPLVQRVSKNGMVVKCKPNPKHTLGFLHFSFDLHKKQSEAERKFHCSCKAFKSSANRSTQKDEVSETPTKPENQKRCIHFYSCICAFASDDKLANEFAHFINLSLDGPSASEPEHRLLALYSDDNDSGIKVEVVPSADHITLLSGDTVEIIPSITDENNDILPIEVKRMKTADDEEFITIVEETAGNTRKNVLLTLLSDADKLNRPPKLSPNKKTSSVPSHKKSANIPVDEASVSITFRQWLASVTERINQTMHYQFSGNPDPLVFHSPQCFFDCLQLRISSGMKKRRLPNSTSVFVRKHALPLGTFTKYSWHITNILHVKQIFDTPEMPLQVTRSFVENRDGTYDLYVPQENDDSNSFRKTENNPLIKPFELKTYLKVGNTTVDQKEPTPFVIEWIPNILSDMKIGELRIRFEYGHQRNGQMENRVVPNIGEAQL